MSWNSVATAQSYHIYRNTVLNASTAALIASTSSTYFDDTTAEEDTLYYYWVTSYNATFGEGGFGTPGKGYWNGLGSPTGVRASDAAYTDKVSITWVVAANAHGYKIYRTTLDIPASATEIGSTSDTFFDDNSVTLYFSEAHSPGLTPL